MKESFITKSLCKSLKKDGYSVATEIANFHRSADIAAISPSGEIIVIECKVSDLKKAIHQTSTHRLSADKVLVATVRRDLKQQTIDLFKTNGVGLYFIDEGGDVELAWQPEQTKTVWLLRREQLRTRILEDIKNEAYTAL